MEKAKPKVEPRIEVRDTYVGIIIKELLCVFLIGTA
jgi:hypothetical protein